MQVYVYGMVLKNGLYHRFCAFFIFMEAEPNLTVLKQFVCPFSKNCLFLSYFSIVFCGSNF